MDSCGDGITTAAPGVDCRPPDAAEGPGKGVPLLVDLDADESVWQDACMSAIRTVPDWHQIGKPDLFLPLPHLEGVR